MKNDQMPPYTVLLLLTGRMCLPACEPYMIRSVTSATEAFDILHAAAAHV